MCLVVPVNRFRKVCRDRKTTLCQPHSCLQGILIVCIIAVKCVLIHVVIEGTVIFIRRPVVLEGVPIAVGKVVPVILKCRPVIVVTVPILVGIVVPVVLVRIPVVRVILLILVRVVIPVILPVRDGITIAVIHGIVLPLICRQLVVIIGTIVRIHLISEIEQVQILPVQALHGVVIRLLRYCLPVCGPITAGCRIRTGEGISHRLVCLRFVLLPVLVVQCIVVCIILDIKLPTVIDRIQNIVDGALVCGLVRAGLAVLHL